MAKSIDISCPLKFNAQGDPNSLGVRWNKWQNSFNIYILAAAVTDNNQKRALLLHCAGDEVQEIFENAPDQGTTYEEAKTALKNYFQPKQNKHFERHVFRLCYQKEGESIDSYLTRLRSLTREPGLNINKVIDIAQASEVASRQISRYTHH